MEAMKRLATLLLLFLGLLARAHGQLALTLPAPTGYVDDFAHVLTDEGRTRIDTICRQIHDQTRAQGFLVTVPSLAGDSIEQFSNDLFHQWKIGEKGTDRGVLVVFATGDHKHRIEVGYGFEGTLNDAKAGDIGRAITPELHALHYDAAGLAAVTQLAAVITPGANIASDPAPPADPTTHTNEPAPLSSFVPILIFCLIAFFIFVIWALILYRRRAGIGAENYRGPGFVDTGSSFSSSSSFFDSSSSSSDSSSDSSSSDSSFSGGDGGDSGGGGASGND